MSVSANEVCDDSRRTTSKRRTGEAGFTLTEVMVVILILGILLSIGIPTLLGARNRAHDVAARSSLTTAAETALVIMFGDAGADLTSPDVTALNAAEPSLTFLASNQQSNGPNEVSVDASSVERWAATVQSRSGTCFGVELTASGTTTFESASCTAALSADVSAPMNVAPMSAASLSSDWRVAGVGADKLIDGLVDNYAHADWQRGQSAGFDLGTTASISEIRLWNRADCCSTRMKKMWIFISDDPISTDLTTAQASGAASFYIPDVIGRPTTVAVNTAGRYVRVFASGEAFHLAEVEIIAVP